MAFVNLVVSASVKITISVTIVNIVQILYFQVHLNHQAHVQLVCVYKELVLLYHKAVLHIVYVILDGLVLDATLEIIVNQVRYRAKMVVLASMAIMITIVCAILKQLENTVKCVNINILFVFLLNF